MLARRRGRVLEEDGECRLPSATPAASSLDRPLDRLHALRDHARDRRGHERGQRAGEAADAQRPAVLAELGELDVGQGEALGQRVGVIERDGARLGEGQPARPAVQQARPPSSRSSAATCWETAGWVSASSRAAAENEPARATARKVSRRRGSCISVDYDMANP